MAPSKPTGPMPSTSAVSSLPRSSAGVWGASHGWALLHHPEDLAKSLLRDGQRFGQDGDVPHIRRYESHVLLLIYDKFGQVAVCFFDAAFSEVAGIAVVLMFGSARPAAGMGTWTAHGRYDQIPGLEALDRRS